MANKGEATQADITAGLENLGSVDSLLQQPRPIKRDSPFRNTTTAKSVELTNTEKNVATPERQPNHREVNQQQAHGSNSQQQVSDTSFLETSKTDQQRHHREHPSTKAQTYEIRLTLPVSKQMKDGCEELASILQKLRTDKSERLTGNTVMRCLIQSGLQNFTLSTGEFANTEEELLQLMIRKLYSSGPGDI